MEKITIILQRKQSNQKIISPQSMVSDALTRMHWEKTDHLAVIDDNKNFLGIVTEHDIVSKSLSAGLISSETLVKDIMSTHFPVAFIEDSVQECMLSMQQYHVRILPVFDGHIFKGVVTTEDILYEAIWNRNEIFDEEREIITY